MPRKKININHKIEYLSILDATGRLDKKLEPDISEDVLAKLHRAMLMARRFDERLLRLQRQGRIGTFPPITGQEAAQLGAIAALRPSDWFVPSFREGAAEAWRGRSIENAIIYTAGYNEGAEVGQDLNNLPMSIPVGSQVLHAVGLAWAIKYRAKDDVAMTFFGDGATSQGDFHEALNFAGVYQLPTIFVCQNNQWAISIPRAQQTKVETLAQKALAYGIHGIQVDGNDILAVYTAAQEAVARARAGQGATLIECVTYRLTMHTTADDPKKYRSEEEVEQWRARDPLPRFQQYLMDKGLLDQKALEKLEQSVEAEIQQVVDKAEARMQTLGDPLVMFEHTYAQMPPHLKTQREAFKQEVDEEQPHG